MSERVCAIVVTYNRKALLVECLETIRKQTRPVDAIYIIDNASTDGTPELLLEKGYIKKPPPANVLEPWENKFEINNLTDGGSIEVYYVRMHENTGCSGGFYEGVKRAYERGYDWLWLMDDDIEPDIDCLKNLLKCFYKDNSLLVVTPAKLFKEGWIGGGTILQDLSNPFWRRKKYFCITGAFYSFDDAKRVLNSLPEIIYVDDVPFEGPLIKKDVVKLVGYPNKDLFICRDDTEYSIRIKQKGKLAIATRALVKRKLLEGNKSNMKRYYYVRNHAYTDRVYGKNFLVRHIRPFIYMILYIGKAITMRQFNMIGKYIKATIYGYLKKLGLNY